MRKIPGGILPTVSRRCLVDDSTTVGASNSRPVTTNLEVALLAVFESIGLSLPAQVEDLTRAAYIPMLSKYIQMMRDTASRETAARVEAEAALAEERARHARILQDIREECREPFIVPALLDAMVVLSQTVDTISQSQAI
ncbi:hypothetical protein BJV78DRAFT_929208 [Lactifluus subvellereus]|nr:hypothetical protein BJV78DRAFT_929208 [Lactifluus subvellereus]